MLPIFIFIFGFSVGESGCPILTCHVKAVPRPVILHTHAIKPRSLMLSCHGDASVLDFILIVYHHRVAKLC